MLRILCQIVVKLFCLVSVVTTASVNNNFMLASGRSLANGQVLETFQRPGMTAILCASLCTSPCGSAVYSTEDNTCITYRNRFYDVDFLQVSHADRHLIINSQSTFEHDGWKLVFRAQSGINISLYDLWVSSGVHHDDVMSQGFPASCLRFDNYESCDKHFRSSVLDNWENIDQVRFALFKDDKEVSYITFDGTGTTVNSWFRQGRVLNSSWHSLSSNKIPHFSIPGVYQNNAIRRFYIFGSYHNCETDKLYTASIDQLNDICIPYHWSVDPITAFPLLLYSTVDGMALLSAVDSATTSKDYDKADVLAVFVKFTA